MTYFVGAVIGGAIPVLLISWLLRRLVRVPLTFPSAAVSVLLATSIGFVLQAFGEANGDFSRVGPYFSSGFEYLRAAWIAVIALGLIGLSVIVRPVR